jgi:hypothetical protein
MYECSLCFALALLTLTVDVQDRYFGQVPKEYIDDDYSSLAKESKARDAMKISSIAKSFKTRTECPKRNG